MLEQVYDPNVFLAFRLLSLYPVFQVFPDTWMKVGLVIFNIVRFSIEYKKEKYLCIEALNPVFRAIVLLGIFPGYFYFIFQKSTNDAGIWLSIALYILVIGGARMLDFGFPKDNQHERKIQMKDPNFSVQRVVLNCVILPIFYLPYLMFYDPGMGKI